jgi:hypothetical protein
VRVVDVKIETACFLKYAADLHCILISGKIWQQLGFIVISII